MPEMPYNKSFPDKKLTPFELEGSDGVRLIMMSCYYKIDDINFRGFLHIIIHLFKNTI